MDPLVLRGAIERELRGNLLPFWREKSVENERGGFFAEMNNQGIVDTDAPHGLILASRLLWAFAALHRQLHELVDLELARRAFDVLESRFRDGEFGGYFWRVDAKGRAVDRSKKTYGQAFCIYALSEHHLATGEAAPLKAAQGLFELIEAHAHDARFGGHIEARSGDWSEADDLRLSHQDMDAAKSMNTHLHLVEAYTNLYRAWPDARVAETLYELISLFGRHIISHEADCHHLRHFFDKAWNRCSDTYTFGHDIEAAWLLCEAAETLGFDDVEARVRSWAIDLARTTLAEGVDADGGLAYEGRSGEVINADRDWWCQAEAVVGFWHAYRLTGDQAFADASSAVWRFIDSHLIDRVNGEWFWRARTAGSIDDRQPKMSEWKGPYHSVRMCLEMMRRLADADGDGR